MSRLRYVVVDVFTDVPLQGNQVAVFTDAREIPEEKLQQLARETNLSETTFVYPPEADGHVRMRIFTPATELPFAGHPTLGSCHVWLGLGGKPKSSEVVQECGAGLVRIKRDGARLAFAAPPLRRSGEVEPDLRTRIARALGITEDVIQAAQWVDNGPGWVAVRLGSRSEVLALKHDASVLPDQSLGVVAPWDAARDGSEVQFEVRAFMGRGGEDPVTGSLNAGIAQWLIGAGIAPPSYVAAQGTRLGRRGRVHVHKADGEIWIGGDSVIGIRGTLEL